MYGINISRHAGFLLQKAAAYSKHKYVRSSYTQVIQSRYRTYIQHELDKISRLHSAGPPGGKCCTIGGRTGKPDALRASMETWKPRPTRGEGKE